MELGIVISQQLGQFLRSILLGGVLGLLYDLLRPWRHLGGRVWGGALDVLFSLTAGWTVFFFVMAGDGELRLFILAGILGGWVLFFCLFSRPLRPVWAFWFGLLAAPIRLLWKNLKKFAKFCKKLFSFSQNWFTIIYIKARGLFVTRRKGAKAVAKKQKTENKRPSSRLTILLLVVLMIGFGVQLYNMYGQLQAAQTEEEVYAQRLAALQETNQRLERDIANSDDPDLIEDIARNQLGMAQANEKIFYFGQ